MSTFACSFLHDTIQWLCLLMIHIRSLAGECKIRCSSLVALDQDKEVTDGFSVGLHLQRGECDV
jgi:hypothetical protein